MFTLLLLAIFISVCTIVYLILNSISNSHSDKVKRYLQSAEYSSGNDRDESIVEERIKHSKNELKITEMLSGLSKVFNSDNSKFHSFLVQAGYRNENATKLFLGTKIFFAIAMGLTFLITGLLLNFKVGAIPISLIMVLIGYIIPNIFLSLKIKNRRDNINQNLPDSLDFLVICVEAGLGLNSALVRVGKEMYARSKVLGEELMLVNQEMRTGISREEAFKNLAARNKSKRLNILVSAILVSDQLGTNIADTLRAQAETLRTEFRQAAEEQAAKAGIKILFPLVLFFLPTLFIIILGPGLIQLATDIMPYITK